MPPRSKPKVIDGIRIIDKNRFSVWVDPNDEVGLADLNGWAETFRQAGIASVVAHVAGRGCAVFRVGMSDDDI